MYFIRRTLVWLQRFRHSRGMGIQSPFAYRFVRYVINEHYPYYAYADLRKHSARIGRKRLKLCRFYLRLTNYCQPRNVIDFAPYTEAYREYMSTGCNNAQITTLQETWDGETDGLPTPVDMARVSLKGRYEQFLDWAMGQTSDHSVFVIEHIHRDKDTRDYWARIINDPRVGVTFDLYYCGVLFFDKKMYKRNYIINF